MIGKKAQVWNLYGRKSSDAPPESSGPAQKDPGMSEEVSGRDGRFVNYTVDGRDGRLTFGKHSGRLISELAATNAGAKYLRWALTKSFPDKFKRVVESQLQRRDK